MPTAIEWSIVEDEDGNMYRIQGNPGLDGGSAAILVRACVYAYMLASTWTPHGCIGWLLKHFVIAENRPSAQQSVD
jgi:hypothetical protein